MTLNAVVTILTMAVVLVLLIRGRLGTDSILVGALGLIASAGFSIFNPRAWMNR